MAILLISPLKVITKVLHRPPPVTTLSEAFAALAKRLAGTAVGVCLLACTACSYPPRAYVVDPAQCVQTSPPIPALMLCKTKRVYIPPLPPVKIDIPIWSSDNLVLFRPDLVETYSAFFLCPGCRLGIPLQPPVSCHHHHCLASL